MALWVAVVAVMPLHAQSREKADMLFKADSFAEALPLYEALAKKVPSNVTYSLRLAVCLYRTGQEGRAIELMMDAAEESSVEDLPRLALAQMHTYRFSEAVESYSSYVAAMEKKECPEAELAPYRLLLAQAQDAERMMNNMEDVQIIDSMIVAKSELLKAYAMTSSVGQFIPYDSVFSGSLEPDGYVVVNELDNRAFYSLKDADGKGDLCSRIKDLDGWNDLGLLRGVNSVENDLYPYVMPDGVTIYFASDRVGGIGGLDLYVSRYHAGQQRYLEPELLAMPFNSTANDYMLVIDEVKGVGWFATDRFQPKDTAIVYTFIPNEVSEMVQSEPDDQLRRRAQIAEVRQSWRKGVDYGAIIAEARRVEVAEVDTCGAFRLVIDDDRVYTSFDDFHNDEAEGLYRRSLDLEKQLGERRRELEWKYGQYNKVNDAAREVLRQEIPTLEREVARLKADHAWCLLESRRKEVGRSD